MEKAKQAPVPDTFVVFGTSDIQSPEALAKRLNDYAALGYTGQTIVVPTHTNDPSVYVVMSRK